METGFPGNFTDVPYELMKDCATDSWIKTLWNSCQLFGVSIQDSFGTFCLARQNDIFIMPHMAQQGFLVRQLEQINECRLHLQAVTLADVCTLDGRAITEEAYNGK